MNSRWLWNSHHRHEFFWVYSSRYILKFRLSETAISRGFEGMFSTEGMLFCQNTPRTGNNAIEMSQAFHNIARFKRFIDLNLFKYAFNVI